MAPEHPTGVVHVELTLNDQQYTRDGVSFEYQDVVAHSVSPRSGPVLGGTLVVVRGANFHSPGARGLFCKFVGADVVAASFEGEEAVRCATPPSASIKIGAERRRESNPRPLLLLLLLSWHAEGRAFGSRSGRR